MVVVQLLLRVAVLVKIWSLEFDNLEIVTFCFDEYNFGVPQINNEWIVNRCQCFLMSRVKV